MSTISRSTLVPISFVIIACSLCFKIGASQTKNDFIVARVEALEIKSDKAADNETNFQKEVLQRLTRIETAAKHLLKGD